MALQTFWLLPEVVSPTHYVAGLTEGFNLAREYRLVPVVIADGGKNGSVGGKGDRRPATSFAAETSDDLGGKMLRIGGTTAVAAPKNLVSSAEGADHAIRDLLKQFQLMFELLYYHHVVPNGLQERTHRLSTVYHRYLSRTMLLRSNVSDYIGN